MVIGLQIAAVYNPFFQKILRTVPLTIMDWVIIVSISTSILVVEEIRKIIYNRRKRASRKK